MAFFRSVLSEHFLFFFSNANALDYRKGVNPLMIILALPDILSQQVFFFHFSFDGPGREF